MNVKRTITVSLFALMLAAAHGVWSADRIELDNTSIVGARELPKVLYIVPWKTVSQGEMTGESEGGSFDDGFTALDREVTQKEAKYYEILYGSADASGK